VKSLFRIVFFTLTTFAVLPLGFSSCSSSLPLPVILSSIFAQGTEKTVANAKQLPVFKVESFKDSANAVRFLVVGDWGTGASLQKRVASAMCAKAGAEKPSFIISTGDNIYNSGVSSTDDPQWKAKFEDIYACENLALPWYVVLGNHDHRGNIQAEIDYHSKNPRWNMPARYFTVVKTAPDGTRIDFFMLDTDPINRQQTAFIEQQKTWLRTELAKSPARWKIVVGHHMIRSHGAYGDQDYMLEHVKPLLDSNGVALYMNGHDHDLQYLKSPEDSFHCLISGSGAEGRNTSYGANTIFASTNGGFHYLAVTKERVYLEFVNAAGAPIFASSIWKPSLERKP
jgi:tartrate-resistant acid phosphatase type 5